MTEKQTTAAYSPAKPFYPERNLRNEFHAAYEFIASLPAKLKKSPKSEMGSEFGGCPT